MKAAVLVGWPRLLEICDLDLPKLEVGQSGGHRLYSGICGKQTTRSPPAGRDPWLAMPHLLGHEGRAS